MFTRRLLAASLLALPFAVPSTTYGWGPEGHQIVALIAYAHLTPQARAATKQILSDGKDIYDAEVADWADIIRRDNKDLGPYHYVDADVNKRAIDLKSDGAEGKNVVDGLATQIAFLAGDTSAPQIISNGPDGKPNAQGETKGQALRWVVHLAGDIAQPLHTCDRNQDAGGNKVVVRFEGQEKPTNLHAVWDGALLRQYVNAYLNSHHTNKPNAKDPQSGRETPDLTDYAMSLDAKIRPADAKAYAAGTPLDWANESHQIAVQYIYGDLPSGSPTPIDVRYVQTKQEIVERQLQAGGIRLAAVLNKAFAKQPTSRPARIRG